MTNTNKSEITTAPASATAESGARRATHMDGTVALGKGKKKAGGRFKKKGGSGRGKGGRRNAKKLGAGKGKSSGAGKRGANRSNKPGRCKGGDPVDILTGEVLQTQEDLILPGEPPWIFRREYSSGWANEKLPFGRGWTHQYHQSITEVGGESVLRDNDGRSVNLGEIEAGSSEIHRGLRLEIRRNGASFELVSLDDASVRVFEPVTKNGPSLLRRIEDAGGRMTVLTYEKGRLQKITTPAKSVVQFSYDPKGRISQTAELSPQGKVLRACHYEYTKHSELSRVVDAAGVEFRFEYDDFFRMSRAHVPTGSQFRWLYDEEGRCIESWGDQKLHHWRFQRDEATGEVVVTGAAQHKVFVFGNQGELLEERGFDGKVLAEYAYDEDLLLIGEANGAGETREYERDALGAVISETDPAGLCTQILHHTKQMQICHPNGTCTRHNYDRRGFLVRTVHNDGTVRNFDRDQFGRVVAISGPEGLIEHREFNDRDQITWKKEATGLETHYRYDERSNLAESSDSLGRVWRFEHDAYGRLLKTTAPDGATTRKEYDAYGHPVREIDELGREVHSEYRGTGELAQVQYSDGRIKHFDRDSNELLIRFRNPLGQEIRYERDLLGRKATEDTPDGRHTEHGYTLAQQERRRTGPNGTFREWSYDVLGNITQESSSHGPRIYERNSHGLLERAVADEGVEQFVVEYELDHLGRIVWERQGAHELFWDYDAHGRVCSRTVDGERTDYEHNVAGQLVAVTHQGKRTTLYRDVAGREVRRATADNKLCIDSQWDTRDRLINRRLITVAQEGGLPPLTVPGKALIADTFTHPHYANARAAGHRRFRWDEAGRLLGVEDRTWGQTTYEYDEADNLKEAVRGRSAEFFVYDAARSLVAAKRMFDGVEQLQRNGGTSVEASVGIAHSTAAVDRWVGSQRPVVPPPPLLPVSPASLMTLGAPSRLESKPGNVLTQHGRFAYETDSAGRRTERRDTKSGEVTHYVWDCRDQLREVKLPDGWRVRLFYDAFGRRVRKDFDPPEKSPAELLAAVERKLLGKEGPPDLEGYSVTYLWDDDELCAELWSDGRRRIHVHDRGSFVPLIQSDGFQVFQVVTDHLGTPKELVDEQGRVVWSVAHGAWGNVVERWAEEEGGPESPFRLLGQLWDEETGLCWTRFRVFENTTARWLSPDPLGLDGGENAFGFDGAPTTVSDPLGLKCSNGKNQRKSKKPRLTPEQKANAAKPPHSYPVDPNQREPVHINGYTLTPHPEGGFTMTSPKGTGKIRVNSDFKTTAAAHNDLMKLASIPSGRKLLDSIMASGKSVDIEKAPSGAGSARPRPAEPYNRPELRNGQGSDATVKYNPNKRPMYPDSDPPPEWGHPSSAVVLGHELCHASRITNGTELEDPSHSSPVKNGPTRGGDGEPFMTQPTHADALEERRAVGLGPQEKTGMPDFSKEPFSENKIRKDLGEPRRTSYLDPNTPVTPPEKIW